MPEKDGGEPSQPKQGQEPKEQRIQPRTLKGFNDYLPDVALRRQIVKERLRLVFERWGYQPLETPSLEYADVLPGRYGAEAEKLVYGFQDHGGRDVALRYDQTVPFGRYECGRVWQGANTRRVRERECTQCDLDVAGAAGPVADAEALVVASE